jgi:hypothetical protein
MVPTTVGVQVTRRAVGVMTTLLVVVATSSSQPSNAGPVGANGDFVVTHGSIYVDPGEKDLYRVDPLGARAVNLTEDGLPQSYANWSPDGRWIIFAGDGRIKRFDRNGERLQLLLDSGRDWSATSPSVSPDGTKIAYVRRSAGLPTEEAQGDIYVLDLKTGESDYLAPTGSRNTEIEWSPDGKQLVFQHWRWKVQATADAGSQVMLVNADGTNLENLTLASGGGTEDWKPSWTRDGRIVFLRYGPCPTYEHCMSDFYRVDPDGSNLERLNLMYTDWTGDGHRDFGHRIIESPDGSMWAVLVEPAERDVSLQLWTLEKSSGDKRKTFEPVYWGIDWEPRCTVLGTAGDDQLVGTSDRDLICGLGGDDVIHGLDGDDSIFGHGGNDRIIGGPGADIVVGNAGRDRCERDSADHSRVC